MSEPAGPLVEHFFRHEYGRLVAQLARRYSVARLDHIEEAVQTALSRALSVWAREQVPDNPAAWLTRVARNTLIDQLRRERTAARVAEQTALADPSIGDATIESGSIAEGFATEPHVGDDELRMLFICCDEQLPEQTQIVLALKLLCGFSTSEIAHRLFLSEANVLKLVTRGKARLAQLWQPDALGDADHAELGEMSEQQLVARVASVQKVIYLLFNEGYSSRSENQVIRRELCGEGLRLAQLLVSQPTSDQPGSWALLALIHFHFARLDARLGPSGQLLLLEEQDRGRWDQHHIHLGMHCLHRSGEGNVFTRYHGEAAVLAEHCLAPTFAATRWQEIVELYEVMERRDPSPLYTLNRAIALAEWKGPQAGLAVLRQQTPPGWLARYYLWDGTLGELLRRAGQFQQAERYLQRAIDLAPTEADRDVFRRRLSQCLTQDSTRREAE